MSEIINLPNAFPEFLKQTCVYWKKTGTDGFGNPSFSAPVEMSCRWDLSRELMQNDNGSSVITKAKVNPKEQVFEEDYLFLGSLSDIAEDIQTNPLEVPDARQVFITTSVVDVSGISVWHTCYLS